MPKRKEHFAFLPKSVITSEAFSTLGSPGHVLLAHAAMQYRKGRNGDISIIQNRYSDYGLSGVNAASRGLKELTERGLLIRTRRGGAKSSQLCSLWGLAWYPIPASPKFTELEGNAWAPTWSYKSWASPPRVRNLPWRRPVLKVVL